MFDLVIFDCDGVLLDSEIISANMLISALDRLGVQIDLAYVARHFLGRSYPTVMETIRREFHLTLPGDFEENYRARLLETFETELRVMPGVADMIAQLRVPYCVATSSSPMRATKSLTMVGLAHLTGPNLFTSTLVARGKPAPDLFLYAADKMGVDPARCLVIEDSLTGIRAGLAAGMQVWRFTGGSHLKDRALDEPEDARPHNRFAHFADFYDIAPELKGLS
jgi:HAD superfamily hydrolase (TIGR01509 family)